MQVYVDADALGAVPRCRHAEVGHLGANAREGGEPFYRWGDIALELVAEDLGSLLDVSVGRGESAGGGRLDGSAEETYFVLLLWNPTAHIIWFNTSGSTAKMFSRLRPTGAPGLHAGSSVWSFFMTTAFVVSFV